MDEICSRYQNQIAELTFHPSTGGVFEVSLNGKNLFSKREAGRFPEAGEVMGLLEKQLG